MLKCLVTDATDSDEWRWLLARVRKQLHIRRRQQEKLEELEAAAGAPRSGLPVPLPVHAAMINVMMMHTRYLYVQL